MSVIAFAADCAPNANVKHGRASEEEWENAHKAENYDTACTFCGIPASATDHVVYWIGHVELLFHPQCLRHLITRLTRDLHEVELCEGYPPLPSHDGWVRGRFS